MTKLYLCLLVFSIYILLKFILVKLREKTDETLQVFNQISLKKKTTLCFFFSVSVQRG